MNIHILITKKRPAKRCTVFIFDRLFCLLQGVVGTNITIKVLCGVMADTSLGDPYARYAAVARLMMDTVSMKCVDVSFNNNLRDMTNTSWDGPAAGGGENESVCPMGKSIFTSVNIGFPFWFGTIIMRPVIFLLLPKQFLLTFDIFGSLATR